MNKSEVPSRAELTEQVRRAGNDACRAKDRYEELKGRLHHFAPDLRLKDILRDIEREIERASIEHAPYSSAHEAYGVLAEEFREFESEVFKKAAERSKDRMRAELVQVACVAVRAILAIC